MSASGTSRHFAAAQQFGRIWSEADINHRAGFMSTRFSFVELQAGSGGDPASAAIGGWPRRHGAGGVASAGRQQHHERRGQAAPRVLKAQRKGELQWHG